MDQIMKLLARILFMCILRCKTGTWITDQTMKLLASAQFMSTLRCKTGTCAKMKLIKESHFFVSEETKESDTIAELCPWLQRSHFLKALYTAFSELYHIYTIRLIFYH